MPDEIIEIGEDGVVRPKGTKSTVLRNPIPEGPDAAPPKEVGSNERIKQTAYQCNYCGTWIATAPPSGAARPSHAFEATQRAMLGPEIPHNDAGVPIIPSDAAPVAWRTIAKSIFDKRGNDPRFWNLSTRQPTGQDVAEMFVVERLYTHPEDAPRITMTKSYLSGRQCCDFTIAEDDSETHEEGCPWRLVDEFAKAVYKRRKDGLTPLLGPWILDRIAKLEEDMANSPIRHPEDAPDECARCGAATCRGMKLTALCQDCAPLVEDAPGGPR